MSELISSLAAGGLWTLLFLLLAATANKSHGKSFFSGSGFLFSYPLFSFLQVVIIKLLSLTHLLNSWAILAIHSIISLGLGILLYHLKDRPLSPPADCKENNPSYFFAKKIVCYSAGIIFVLLLLVSLLIPIHFLDDMTYHLPMVANYFQNQSLNDWATQCLRQITRPYATELQMLNLAFISRSDAWMELPNLLALFVSLVAVFEIAKRVLSRKDLAFLCVAFVLTARQILLGPVTASNDLPFMALILCSFYWLLQIVGTDFAGRVDGCLTNPQRDSKIIPILFLGLTVGLAIATKVLGICIAATLLTVMLILLLLKCVSWPTFAGFSFSGLIFTLILSGDIFWKNIARGVIPLGITSYEQNVFLGFPGIVSVAKYYLYELCFKRYFDPQNRSYGASHYGYVYPFAFIAGSLKAGYELAVFRKGNTSLGLLGAFGILLFLFSTIYKIPEAHDQRFMIWMIPVFGIIAASLLRTLKTKTISILVLLMCLLSLFSFFQTYTQPFLISMTQTSIQNLFRNHSLIRFVDLFQNGELHLSSGRIKKINGYDVLEKKVKNSDWILIVGGESSEVYPAWGKRFTRTVHGVWDLNDAVKKIESLQYSWIIFERQAEKTLREGSLAAARKNGYRAITKSVNRIIAARPRPNSITV